MAGGGGLRIHWGRFAALSTALAVLNALLLALYFHDQLAWRWVVAFDWSASFLVPRESEEALGPLREGGLIWLAALPWLAVCALVLSLGRRRPARG